MPVLRVHVPALVVPGHDPNHATSGARYLETLRQSERTDANLTPATRAFYGLLPASISHEGYAAKPMHSYWDDFWGLKGYDGAIAIANIDADRQEIEELLGRVGEHPLFRMGRHRGGPSRRRRA